ncbi:MULTISPECIES: hypothetical protein [Cellulophaga]|jgi:hypothetical protein|uniref:Uncharacterized protein n=2 Tax=Cellulophaga baltica TaxID=76594 RepID=A0A1G7I8Q9_9FLAO|nr:MULTISPECIES: hypothetical protein [Cellulophaga]AIZ42100.1 hypothetical protein M666_11185 [Cellulophaga baltica 18]KGK28925.1 hypothetical protein EL45_16800 [Cellulophaga sp. E6(2014)]SDF08906.1 hypothetical protein SAMN04487992_107101 [Cellulophaga baltica]
MPYQEVFVLFWEQVKESIQEGRFAKLTMAKTIGKPELKNIFLRPVYSDKGFKVLLKFRYRSRDTEDQEQELSLEEALEVIKPHIKNPFLSVLLFTTSKDVIFKVNKKGVGSITETFPSFQNVTQAKSDLE